MQLGHPYLISMDGKQLLYNKQTHAYTFILANSLAAHSSTWDFFLNILLHFR